MDKKAPSLPSVWDDDTRMSVLFAPFREKSLNPSSWEQKMNFWVQAILDESLKSGVCLVDAESLQKKFCRKGKVPLCLDIVLDEMHRCKSLQKLSETRPSPVKQRSSWLTWGFDTFLKTPVTWGYNYLSSNSSKMTKFVVLEVLHSKCKNIVDQHYCGLYCEVTDSVIEYSQLWKKSMSVCKNEGEFQLILEELVKQKKIALHHENTQIFIKFADKNTGVVKALSKRDVDIHRIKTTRDMLMDRIDNLSTDIERLKTEALKLKKTSKTQAIRCLRQKKIIENRIGKLTGSLDILDNILDQIGHSASDEMVVNALESGNSVLKSLTGKTSADHVADVMDELSEILEQQSDIQEQISSGPSNLDVSREELENELDDLLKEETDKPDTSGLLIDNLISGLSDLHLPTKAPTSLSEQKITPQQSPHSSPQSVSKEMSPKSLLSTQQRVDSPSQYNSFQKSTPRASNISSEDLDLSLELPEVPTFKPSVKQGDACLDS